SAGCAWCSGSRSKYLLRCGFAASCDPRCDVVTMAEFPRVLLGIGWGAVVATFISARRRRAHVVTRIHESSAVATVAPRAENVRGRIRALAGRAAVATGPAYRVVRALVIRRRAAILARAVEREIPVALDLLGVAVGAGCTPYLALDVAAQWSPPP